MVSRGYFDVITAYDQCELHVMNDDGIFWRTTVITTIYLKLQNTVALHSMSNQCPKITFLPGCQSGKFESRLDSKSGNFGAKCELLILLM